MIRALKASLFVVALAVLGGCASEVKLNDTPVESRAATPTGGANGGAGAGGAGQSQVQQVDLGGKGDAAVSSDRTIYFDLDSYIVKDEFRSIVEAHAKRLSADRKKRLVIEGHTDERGGSEYNLALGQKRAEAVVKALSLLGVQDGQLEAVSFGKERPAAEGHDESAWSKNRRAELKDR